MVLAEYDRDELRDRFLKAQPFPFIEIDGFLLNDFAHEVASAYPSFESAAEVGHQFEFVNETGKIQVTDPEEFPNPVQILSRAICSSEFVKDLEHITGIPNLISDPDYAGGGMHLTGPSGRLDVHVDFNYIAEQKLHRRLNLLLYLNPVWESAWGGSVELWDDEVKRCHHAFEPLINRCVLFETSEISYHGVQPVTCPEGMARNSFAAYYYTQEAPEGWDGRQHTTRFRARPDEKFRGMVLMPLEKVRREAPQKLRRVVRRLRGR